MASQERKGTEKLKVFFTPSAESFIHSVLFMASIRGADTDPGAFDVWIRSFSYTVGSGYGFFLEGRIRIRVNSNRIRPPA